MRRGPILRPTPRVSPAAPGRLTERVADHIEAVIAENGLSAGMKLPGERVLCERFGVSRTVLREAVRILEQRGAVEVMPARGIFVTEGGPQRAISIISNHLKRESLSFEELVEGRRFLEVHAGRLAAVRKTPEQLALLRDNVNAMRDAIDAPEAFMEEDLRFHQYMSEAAGNRLYVLWLQPIMDNLLMTRQNVIMVRAVRERILALHEAIFRAVEASDAEQVGVAVNRHLDQFVEDTRWVRTFA